MTARPPLAVGDLAENPLEVALDVCESSLLELKASLPCRQTFGREGKSQGDRGWGAGLNDKAAEEALP